MKVCARCGRSQTLSPTLANKGQVTCAGGCPPAAPEWVQDLERLLASVPEYPRKGELGDQYDALYDGVREIIQKGLNDSLSGDPVRQADKYLSAKRETNE